MHGRRQRIGPEHWQRILQPLAAQADRCTLSQLQHAESGQHLVHCGPPRALGMSGHMPLPCRTIGWIRTTSSPRLVDHTSATNKKPARRTQRPLVGGVPCNPCGSSACSCAAARRSELSVMPGRSFAPRHGALLALLVVAASCGWVALPAAVPVFMSYLRVLWPCWPCERRRRA